MLAERGDFIIQAAVAVFVVLCATIVAIIPSVSSANQIIPGDALIALYATTLGYLFGAGQLRRSNWNSDGAA